MARHRNLDFCYKTKLREVRSHAESLLALCLLFSVVRPPVIWPWEGSNYPSRSCNGLHGPKGPKFKKQKKRHHRRAKGQFAPSTFDLGFLEINGDPRRFHSRKKWEYVDRALAYV